MRQLPNILSILRLILVGILAVFLLRRVFPADSLVPFWLALIIVFTDLLDGALARHLKAESTLGSFLDTVADTAFVFVCWIALYVDNRIGMTGLVLALGVRVLTGISILIKLTIKKNWDITHTVGDKLGGATQFVTILLFLIRAPYTGEIFWVMIGITYTGLCISIVQRFRLSL